MKGPTEIQARVLAFISARITEGLPPTQAEITTAFGWSGHAAAAHHLSALEKKGLIRRRPGARNIQLVGAA